METWDDSNKAPRVFFAGILPGASAIEPFGRRVQPVKRETLRQRVTDVLRLILRPIAHEVKSYKRVQKQFAACGLISKLVPDPLMFCGCLLLKQAR